MYIIKAYIAIKKYMDKQRKNMLTLYRILPPEKNCKYTDLCAAYLDSFYRGLEHRPNTNLHLYNTCAKHVDIVFKALITNTFTFDEAGAYFTTVVKKAGRMFSASENRQIKHYVTKLKSNRETPLHLLFVSTNVTHQKNTLSSFAKSSNEMSNAIIDLWTEYGLIKHSSFHTGNYSHIKRSAFKLLPIFNKYCDKNRIIDIHDNINTHGIETYINDKLHSIILSTKQNEHDDFYIDDILVLGFCMKILTTSFKLTNLLNAEHSIMFCSNFKELEFYDVLKNTTDTLIQCPYFSDIRNEKLSNKSHRGKGKKNDIEMQHMQTSI